MTAITQEGHSPASLRRAPLIGPDGTYTRNGQALAFVLGVIGLLFVPATLAAALLYTRAETLFATEPEEARRLVSWSWIALMIVPVLGIVTGLIALVVSVL
ncbi:hypothetical protein [Actinomadura sp. HBU206391]|uniref:hypothetical protein n=1 Tax=Actinomadura sp. HBU206391 TaxID=2731692 RepID=UPI00164F68E5|nr:hypothetical protein [Actinomadura sp. HBU206391]MBC6458734.1 hypothetical protein [Actinomadura sp. HBU206391]